MTDLFNLLQNHRQSQLQQGRLLQVTDFELVFTSLLTDKWALNTYTIKLNHWYAVLKIYP